MVLAVSLAAGPQRHSPHSSSSKATSPFPPLCGVVGWARRGRQIRPQWHSPTTSLTLPPLAPSPLPPPPLPPHPPQTSLDFYYGRSWDIGRSSLIVWAMGAAPSKDTFWTTDNGNQSTTRGGCDKSGCPPDHTNAGAILHTMLTALSTGPVGFSDAPGETDAVLIGRTCDVKGNLLQPSKPLTAVDSTHDVTPGAAPSGYALITHTSVQGSVWLRLVVSHQMDPTVTPAFALRGLDIYPAFAAGETVAVTTWAQLQLCAQGPAGGPNCGGANVTPLVAPADPHTRIIPVPVPAKGEDVYTPTLTLLARVCPGSGNGVALFGELDKFATVSVQRFTSIACAADGVSATLEGAEGETVRLAWWAPKFGGAGAVAVGNVTFPGSAGGPGRSSTVCAAGADGGLVCGPAA
jgi:hypothetical protein